MRHVTQRGGGTYAHHYSSEVRAASDVTQTDSAPAPRTRFGDREPVHSRTTRSFSRRGPTSGVSGRRRATRDGYRTAPPLDGPLDAGVGQPLAKHHSCSSVRPRHDARSYQRTGLRRREHELAADCEPAHQRTARRPFAYHWLHMTRCVRHCCTTDLKFAADRSDAHHDTKQTEAAQGWERLHEDWSDMRWRTENSRTSDLCPVHRKLSNVRRKRAPACVARRVPSSGYAAGRSA